MSAAVSVHSVSKHFGAVRALHNVSLEFQPGEIHGIVGENGAGKSTLMKVLSGLEQPTDGQLNIRGTPTRLRGVPDALNQGIVMIHQELNLVNELTVADNIFLGREPTRFGFVDDAKCKREARTLLERIGHKLDPSRLVRDLSIADKQMVEIAKALSYDARVLIMDEPTATLTQHEADTLLALVEQLREAGTTIIFISHILPQVLRISDRITVLRDGEVVTTLDTAHVRKTTDRELASLMVGRSLADYFPARKVPGEAAIFSVKDLSVDGVVDRVSCDVRKGEIFGLAGLIGAGRTETAEAIAGLRSRSSGRIELHGQKVTINSPVDAANLGIAYLSEDRKDAGLTLNMSIVDNTTLVSLARYSRGLIDDPAREKATRKHADRLQLRAGDLAHAVSTLSGGNQQKVLLAKWLEIAPKVLIVDEPTRGVDIGAKQEIYRLIQELASEGMACVLISSEMNELIGMCHRIGVMRLGRLVTVFDGPNATEEQIIHAAGLETANT